MTPPAVPVPTAPAPYAESLDPHPDYPGVRNFLVSISAMPAYAHLSVEELRLCDYTAAGSAAVPFACTLDVDADPPAVFGSLVAMPEYKHASIEEVRLEDYWVVDGGKAVRPVADHVFAEGAPAVLPANDDAFRIARGRPGDGMDDATRGGRPRRVPRGRTQYGVRTRLRRRVEQLDRLGATPEGPASDSDPEPEPEPPRPASPPARTPERRRLPRRPHALGRSPSVPLAPPSSRPCLATSSSAHGLGASPRRRRSDELCESPAPTAGRARASLFRQLQAMARKAEAIDDALAAGGEDADAVQSLVAKAEEFSAALDKVSAERGPAFGRHSEATGTVQRNLDAFAFSPRKGGPRYFDDPGFVGPLPKRTSFDAFVAPYPVYRARRAEEETALEAGGPCSKPRLDTASAVGGGSGVRSSPVTPFVVGDAVGQPAGSSAGVVRELPDKEEDAPADDAHALQFVPMMSVSLGPDRAQAAGPVSQRKPIVSAVFKPLSGTLSPELTAASLKAETTKAEPSLVRAPKREAILAGSDDGETTALAKSPGAMSYRVRAADRPDTRKRDIAGALSPVRPLPGRRKMRTFRAAKKTKSEPDGTFDGGRSPFDFDGVLPGASPGASPSKPPTGGSSVARKLERFGGHTVTACVSASNGVTKHETGLEKIFPAASAVERKTMLSAVEKPAFSMGSPPKDRRRRVGRSKAGPSAARARASPGRKTLLSRRSMSDNPFLRKESLDLRKLQSMEQAAAAEAFPPAVPKRENRFVSETENDFASESDSSPVKASSDEDDLYMKDVRAYRRGVVHELASSSGSPVASPSVSVGKGTRKVAVEADSDVFKSVRLLTAALEASAAEPLARKSTFEHRVLESGGRSFEDNVMRNVEDIRPGMHFASGNASEGASAENGARRNYEIVALPHFGLPNVAPKKDAVNLRGMPAYQAKEEEVEEETVDDIVIDGEVMIDEEVEIETDEEVRALGDDENILDDEYAAEDASVDYGVTSSPVEEEPFFIVLSRDASENSDPALCPSGAEFTVENASAEVVISPELSCEHGAFGASARDGRYSGEKTEEELAPISLSERLSRLQVSDSSEDDDSFEAHNGSIFSESSKRTDTVAVRSPLTPSVKKEVARLTAQYGENGMRNAPPVAAELPKRLAKFEPESDQEQAEGEAEEEEKSGSEFESEEEAEDFFSPTVPRVTAKRRASSFESEKRRLPPSAPVRTSEISESIANRVQLFQDMFLHGAPVDEDFERMARLDQMKTGEANTPTAVGSTAAPVERELPSEVSSIAFADNVQPPKVRSSLPRGMTIASGRMPRKATTVKPPLKRHSTAAAIQPTGLPPTSPRMSSNLRGNGAGFVPLGASIANALSSRVNVGSTGITTSVPASAGLKVTRNPRPGQISIVDSELAPFEEDNPVSPVLADAADERTEKAGLAQESLSRRHSLPPRRSEEFDEVDGGRRGAAGNRLVAMRSMHETDRAGGKTRKRASSRGEAKRTERRKSRAKSPMVGDRARAKSPGRGERAKSPTGRSRQGRGRTVSTALSGVGGKRRAQDDHDLAPRASTDVGTGRKSMSEAISPTTVAVQMLIAEETTRMSVQGPEERVATKAGFVESVRKLFGRKGRKPDGEDDATATTATTATTRRMSLSRAREKTRESLSSRPSTSRRAQSEYRSPGKARGKK